ncbi:MAG: alanyl-tRNA editing protein [Ruminococcaceae bacterium]|nr:alanyl-tRNA editing protein [Oscillospiraceae bacterium]
MTEKLYDIDSHLKEFTATVIDSYQKADGYVTVLDRTAFFPEGGGQASDIGYINGAKVYDVRIQDGIIYHYTSKPFKKGETVLGKLDFERRFDFMQQHSAEHIVSGIAHKYYACENVGFHLGEDIVTLDFDKSLTREDILRIEALSNEAVFKNVGIKAYYPDSEALKAIEYRSKKEIEGAVRIVEIEGVDSCACCAPHVNFSGEIGLIKLLGFEKLRGGVRIELKAGRRALADYNEKYLNVSKISSALCVKQNETADAVERLQKQLSDMKFELTGVKKQILLSKVESFVSERYVTALFEEALEIKDLQYLADALYKKAGGVRAVFSPISDGFSFAICGDEAKLSEFFKAFKKSFSVRGGGRGTMVQGTVVTTKDELMSFLDKEA